MSAKKLTRILKVAGLCLVVTAALYAPNLILAANSTITVTAPVKVSPGQTFTASINVVPGGALAGVQLNLSYDSNLLTLVQVQEGTLLSQGGNSTYFQPGTTGTGSITGMMGVIITPTKSVSAAGTFATVTFTAKSQGGVSPLSLTGVIAGDLSGQPLPVTVTSGQVMVNRAPVMAATGSKTVNEGQLLQFTVSASDADGDSLTYSATGLPTGAAFNPATRTFTWTPTYAQAGAYNVTFQVTDGSSPVQQSVTITVGKLYADSDVNGDAKVNVLDMTTVGQHWGQTGLPGWIREDINDDGTVNVLDMVLIGQNWTG